VVGKIAVGVMLGIFATCAVCCLGALVISGVSSRLPTQPNTSEVAWKPQETSPQPEAPKSLLLEVPKVELVKVWMEGRLLKVAWKNVGSVPVAGVKADVRFWNQYGDLLSCSTDRYFIFTASNPTEIVMPSSTHYPLTNEGYAAILKPGEQVQQWWAGNLRGLSPEAMP